jgi:multiple sugar transport system ATP-binding protein
MAAVRVVGLTRRYGEVVALGGVDLDVGEGETLTVVGPSGSGKSTLLRLVAGLEEPTAGSVHIGDRDVTSLAPAARDVSMVFQSYALFPHLTVAGNIGFGLSVRRVDRRVADVRVRDVAELVGCQGLLERHPAQLSGGERQRVALARALARDPDVLLLDEPLSNLDAQLRLGMRAELHALRSRVSTPMIHVTHDQVEASTLGDRVAVLAAGTLQQVGTPDDTYWRPATRFVATFIGSPPMNVVPTVVDGSTVRVGGFAVDLGDGPPAPDGAVEAGIRPEHLLIGAAAAGQPGSIGAQVRSVEMAGADTYVRVDVAGVDLLARVPSTRDPAPSGSVPVALPAERLYLFDGSGRTVRFGDGPT